MPRTDKELIAALEVQLGAALVKLALLEGHIPKSQCGRCVHFQGLLELKNLEINDLKNSLFNMHPVKGIMSIPYRLCRGEKR